MKKLIFILSTMLMMQQNMIAQCNQGLNLGAVIVPTNGNAANGGNFLSIPAWQQAANWLDTFNLDYRQRYITWTDVVREITGGVPAYNHYSEFENSLTTWAGNVNVHVVYPVIKVEQSNTLLPPPAGFTSAVSASDPSYFSDTAFINQNYLAIKHILQNVNNVKWISVGNEIDSYFKAAYWGTGRLTRYGAFLDTVRNRMNADGFSNVKLGSVVAFHNLTWSGNYNIIDSIRPHVDFVGYTFYYTSLGPPADTCWANPATVTSWLNIARAKAGSKKMLLTETCMGDGGGVLQNCGSPLKQFAYADALLNWYSSDTSNVAGITWFTVVDPYLGWQTPNTLWNTCGLVDSSGVTVQPAGTLWQHNCITTGFDEVSSENNLVIYPNPFFTQTTLQTDNFLNDATVIVYNFYGQVVNQIKNISSQKVTLYRDTLASGLYFIQLIQDHKVIAAKKIIIAD